MTHINLNPNRNPNPNLPGPPGTRKRRRLRLRVGLGGAGARQSLRREMAKILSVMESWMFIGPAQAKGGQRHSALATLSPASFPPSNLVGRGWTESDWLGLTLSRPGWIESD